MTSTGPATGMSRTRWRRRECRLVPTTPQSVPPRFGRSLDMDTALSEAQNLCFKNAVVRQVEDGGGSIRAPEDKP